MMPSMELPPSAGAPGAGSVEAWYHAHAPDLVRLAALACGDRAVAEDAVQEVFAGLLRTPPRLDDPSRPLPYLRVSVLNRCRSRLRRRAKGEEVRLRLVADSPTMIDDLERDAVAAATRAEVLDAVRRLPDRQRDVVLLRYWLDLSEAEIADTLGVSPGTVKSAASRARRSLAPVLEAQR